MTNKHPLEKYLKDNGITKVAFAASCDISRMTLHRIIKREGEFTTTLIKRVCKETGNYVRPSDFFEAAPCS